MTSELEVLKQLEWIRTWCLLSKISKVQGAQHRFHSTSCQKTWRHCRLIAIGMHLSG